MFYSIYSGGITKADSTSHKISIDNLTSANDVEGLNPREFEVYQNYPNPFNPSTTIKYQIANAGFVTLEVFNSLGEVAATLISEFKQAGTYQLSFNGTNLPSGVYIYILKSGNFIQSKKMILLK